MFSIFLQTRTNSPRLNIGGYASCINCVQLANSKMTKSRTCCLENSWCIPSSHFCKSIIFPTSHHSHTVFTVGFELRSTCSGAFRVYGAWCRLATRFRMTTLPSKPLACSTSALPSDPMTRCECCGNNAPFVLVSGTRQNMQRQVAPSIRVRNFTMR